MTEGPKTPKTIRPKKVYYRFEPIIQPNYHLVNFDVLIETVKNVLYIEDVVCSQKSLLFNGTIAYMFFAFSVLWSNIFSPMVFINSVIRFWSKVPAFGKDSKTPKKPTLNPY